MSFIFILVFFLSCTSSVLSTSDDELLVLKIKKQLRNPEILSSWVKGFDFCKKILYPNPSAPFVHVMCNADHRVSRLEMSNLDIHAPFPDAICGLTALTSLSIYGIPGLRGPIPSCITQLSNLRFISIVETSLSGSVPNFSANNSKLIIIELSKNRLSGKIPPSLANIPLLIILDLSSNYLTGSIPAGMFANFVPRFDENPSLLLANNKLTGELPESYGSVNFYELNVANNKLSGNASFLFGPVRFIEVIVLANNSFRFDLSHVELTSQFLSKLDLSHNEIYGKVPWSFANSSDLRDLNLSYNRLCGELPQGGYMERFNSTVFANNLCLCGSPLPPCFNSSTSSIQVPPAPAPAPY